MSPYIRGNYKGVPPMGFDSFNRSREDLLKGTLLLLRDHGPSTTTEILCTQETTSNKVKELVEFMKANGLITIMVGMQENTRLPNMGVHFITTKGKKILKILEEMDAMMPLRPSADSYRHAGDRGITPKERGKAHKLRNKEMIKKW